MTELRLGLARRIPVRSLKGIELLTRSHREMRVEEFREEVGIEGNKAHQYIAMLLKHGYLRRSGHARYTLTDSGITDLPNLILQAQVIENLNKAVRRTE